MGCRWCEAVPLSALVRSVVTPWVFLILRFSWKRPEANTRALLESLGTCGALRRDKRCRVDR